MSFDGGPVQPTGDPVKLTVRWKDGDKTTVKRAEDLLYNVKSKQPMKHQYWVFCGSIEDPEYEIPYLADVTGNIVTTFHDNATVLDNPSEGGSDDDLLSINPEVCPKPGTPITLIFEAGPKQPKKEGDETGKAEPEPDAIPDPSANSPETIPAPDPGPPPPPETGR